MSIVVGCVITFANPYLSFTITINGELWLMLAKNETSSN
jgi:hypothetical protein